MSARYKLIGAALACLLVGAGLPAASSAGVRPFISPTPRPTNALERPTDHPDPNRNEYTVRQAPRSPACGPHFCVHWVAKGPDAPNLKDSDADGVPDYVERVLSTAEYVYSVENGALGWQPPKPDGKLGGGKDKTDIYLLQLGGALFGYAAPDQGQASKEHRLPRRLYGYLVLDNNYARSEFPGTKQGNDLEVTLAHEYNHILQFGYDAFQDTWFAEATATWMEDQVYGEVNDYLRYVHSWVRGYDTPVAGNDYREYGSAVWNHWLAARYGPEIIRSAWERAIHFKPAGFSVAAYDSAIRAAGSSNFNRDFALFSRDVAEWRIEEAFGEGNLYPDVPRQGGLSTSPSAPPVERSLNHTTFQLLRVDAPAGKAVVVRAKAPGGVAAALALVGRVGPERSGYTVSDTRYKPRGGWMQVKLEDPGAYNRITAVVVNADTKAIGFDPRRLDWGYTGDGEPFKIKARVVR
ncbi:MAG TPA: MXAN_6640 family putative metalloprotease [Solirubrobacterales bacterium]|nr:MXAN_6640 family putative metalloprotease [Solirubrobacterales bacterium]